MPISCTGGVRYHVSDHLCDRHPYNTQTSFETQRDREKNRVMHSHSSVAPDALLSSLVSLDTSLEKLKALRVINLHCASAEGKIQFIKKGVVKALAITLREAMRRGIDSSDSDPSLEAHRDGSGVGVAKQRPMVASVVAASNASWFAVEQSAAQVLRSLCAVPQGCLYVVEQGGFVALVASLTERKLGANPDEPRVAARTSAAAALSLLTANVTAVQLMCVGPEAVGTDMHLSGYSLREACEDESNGDQSATNLFFQSTESREKATNLLFEVLGDCLVKDKGLSNLILSTVDVIANVTKFERGLHLGLISGILRAINACMDGDVLVDTAWSNHVGAGGASSSVNGVIGKAVHDEPGSAPGGLSGVAGSLASAGLESEVEGKTVLPKQSARDRTRGETVLLLLTTLWNIGLDSVGQKEILELPAVVTNMAKVLFLALSNSTPLSLLKVKAMAAGALGAASLMPPIKILCSEKLTTPPPSTTEGEGSSPDCTQQNVLDLLLTLLREASSELEKLKKSTGGDGDDSEEDHLGDGIKRSLESDVSALTNSKLKILPHAEVVKQRELSSCVVNSVQALRLIVELPAAKMLLHQVFQTNSPPANLDGPEMTIDAIKEGTEHDLRRAIFYNTKWEKEFKVYVYRD